MHVTLQLGHETTPRWQTPMRQPYIRVPIDLQFIRMRVQTRDDVALAHAATAVSVDRHRSQLWNLPSNGFHSFFSPDSPATDINPYDISNAFKVLFIRSSRAEDGDGRNRVVRTFHVSYIVRYIFIKLLFLITYQILRFSDSVKETITNHRTIRPRFSSCAIISDNEQPWQQKWKCKSLVHVISVTLVLHGNSMFDHFCSFGSQL